MKFSSEQTVVTCGVSAEINDNSDFAMFVLASLKRHFKCDWGDTLPEDCVANDMALVIDDRILSAYIYPLSDKKIWILTECDRSATTILFPEEY